MTIVSLSFTTATLIGAVYAALLFLDRRSGVRIAAMSAVCAISAGLSALAWP